MIAAGIEGGSKYRIRTDWSLQDYRAQRDYWLAIGGPPHLVQIAIAEALGVKFQRASGGEFIPASQSLEQADPLSLAAYLGQSGDVLPYAPPRQGLIIDPGGNS